MAIDLESGDIEALISNTRFLALEEDFSFWVLTGHNGKWQDRRICVIPYSFDSLNQQLVLALPGAAWGKRLVDRPWKKTSTLHAHEVGLGGEGEAAIPITLALVPGSILKHMELFEVDSESALASEVQALPFCSADGSQVLPLAEQMAEEFHEFLDQLPEGYQTAGSGGGPPIAHPKITDAQRLNKLEEQMGGIADVLTDLRNQLKPPPTGPTAQPKRQAQNLSASGSGAVPSLDPSVVKAAREAGIPLAELQKISSLLVPPPRLRTERPHAESVPVGEGPILGDDDEEDRSAEPDQTPKADPLTLVLQKLTDVAEGLSGVRPKTLEQKLEAGAEGSLTGPPGLLSGSRTSTAAWLAMGDEVDGNPDYVVRTIQSRMRRQSGEFGLQEGTHCPDPYFWAEHRSAISDHAAYLNWTWIICGIVHALQRDRPKVALARALLALAGADQVARDRGNWMVAWELQFQDEPPYERFRRAPAVGTVGRSSRLPYTPLVDPRWGENALSRLKEVDDSQERMRKLNRPFPPSTNQPGQDGQGNLKTPKGKGKGEKANS